jgi:type IV pilus assembly protein PilN
MMIRINLLPVKAAKRREQGQRQLLLGAVILTAAIVTIIVFHTAEARRVSDLQTKNRDVERTINDLKVRIGDYDKVVKDREDLMRQAEAIRQLQANRSGPVWMMRELSDVLTKGKGPTFDKEKYAEATQKDPNAGFNANWESKRVWLLSYEEKRHAVKLRAAAKSDEDVAEFLKRLKQSAFFSDVYWQGTQPQFDPKINVAYVTFDVTCRVNY